MTVTCPWATEPGIMKEYHDMEWGVPVFDDGKMFEFLVLESAQAGLSWMTVLKKRENYRQAFCDFDPEKIASFTPERVNSLLQNPGIIRNRMKIEAAVNNAGIFLNLAEQHGSFCNFLWRYTDGKPIMNNFSNVNDVPVKSVLSQQISRDLKKLGFRFFGPVICYSHMQATGMINDHMTFCFRHRELSTFHETSLQL